MNIIIRKEKPADFKKTEYMTLRSFWNLHGAGCNEHYLVRVLRQSDAYLPQFSRVAECDGQIVGAIFYSKSKVVDGESGRVHEVVTFGPLCVEPLLRDKGIGSRLLNETIPLVKEAGVPGIVIFGEPEYYPKHGFKTCDNFGITTSDGGNFDAFMAYPLDEKKFAEIHGKFYEDSVFEKGDDAAAVEKMTAEFPYHKPLSLTCQWLHKERLGEITEVSGDEYEIQFWETKITARLKDDYKTSAPRPKPGDYVTFEYNADGTARIISVCEEKK